MRLAAENLKKSYKKREVIKDVSLYVDSAEVVGLLGPNGAGKTTSFYMMVGLIGPDHGKIILGDEDITDLPIHVRARKGLGYLAQEASVFRKLSVWENIFSILELRAELSKPAKQDRLEELLNDFQLGHLRDTLGISLSGGERRRLEIARALAMEPNFILLDEPFAGVDPISVGDIQSIIKQLVQRNIGVLITDHNVRETLGICDRGYILSEGTILTSGSPDSIMKNEKARAVYFGENFQL